MQNILSEHDNNRAEKMNAFDRLLTMMNELRENCPWDKKQTMQTLRHLTIEETYELSDAILAQEPEEIKKELGDLMLHLVFYSRIAEEEKHFDIAEVMNLLCERLKRRHPHIYGTLQAKDENEVKANWEKIKLKEEGNRSVLGGVPKSLPALIKAMRIQEKVRSVGFDWAESDQVWEKVMEEIREFREEEDQAKKKKEFGDLLFSLINYARFIGVNPDEALESTNKKFIRRFQFMELAFQKEGKSIAEATLEEMDQHWERSKEDIP